MNFHVYIEQELQSKLQGLCRKTGRKRNAIIREALREYVEKHAERTWPEEVFRFKPAPDLPRFESLRGKLVADRENIFADKPL